MSKVTGPLFSLDAKGTLKKAIVFQGAIASGKVNKYRKQKDAESERQLLVRILFDEARQRWNAASSETKVLWNNKAKFKNKTGYDLFLQHSINNLYTMDYKKSLSFFIETLKLGAKPPVGGIEGVYSYLEFQEQALEANEQYIFISFRIPRSYKPGAEFRLRVAWYSDAEILGDVKWEIQVGHVLADTSEKVDDSPHTFTWIDTTRATAKEICLTDGVDFCGCALVAGQVVGVTLKRKSADVLDTLSGGVRVILVRCRYISDRLGEKV